MKIFLMIITFFVYVKTTYANTTSQIKVIGNGGNAQSLEFQAKVQFAIDYLTLIDSKIINITALKSAIQDTHIIWVENKLFLQGSVRDAINYPFAKIILVNIEAWNSANDSLKTLLALHEYLGIMGVDDSSYQVSSQVSTLLPKLYQTICGKFQINGLSFQIIDGKYNPSAYFYSPRLGFGFTDPKNIVDFIWRDDPEGKLYCITGTVTPFSENEQTMYQFTHIESLMSYKNLVE